MTITGIEAQYQQWQYTQNYQPVQQIQQPVPTPGKVTGYDANAVIPRVANPLNNLHESQSNPQYVDFINQLYRFDRTKSALQHESQHRQKRAIIFRPMFVYKQQKVKKEKVKAAKDAGVSSERPVANQAQYYKDKQNHVYKEYNSFYEPYRYGQRYPYRNYWSPGPC